MYRPNKVLSSTNQNFFDMSLSRLIIHNIGWDEFLHILSYLSVRDLYEKVGHLNRSGWLTFLREKTYRSSSSYALRQSGYFPRLLPYIDKHDRVLLVSYPRSGNSMLRQKLELRLKIVTGSDSRPNRTLSSQLLQCGYQGEGITDNSVWIVKTHYPERLGFIKYKVDRIVLLVRNPYDAITSYFHMAMTNTHEMNLSATAFESVRHIYKDFVANEAKIWHDFHDFWYAASKQLELPLLAIRYEDVINQEKESMDKIERFLVDGHQPSRYHMYSKHLSHNQPSPPSPSNADKPRYQVKRGGFGKALDMMHDDEVASISRLTQEYNQHLGYRCTDDTCTSSSAGIKRYRLEVESFNNVAPDIAQPGHTLTSSFRVNEEAYDLRSVDDKYGRKMTDLRRSLTKLDTEPFETA